MIDLKNISIAEETIRKGTFAGDVKMSAGITLKTETIISRFENNERLRQTVKNNMRQQIWHHCYGELITPLHRLRDEFMLRAKPHDVDHARELFDEIFTLLKRP